MRFELKAVRDSGAVVSVDYHAADEGDAVRQATLQGYTVLTVRPKQSLKLIEPGRKPDFPLVLLSQELMVLLNAGLPLVEALESLAEKEHRAEIKQVIDRIIAGLREGQKLSQALEQQPLIFTPLYIATVRASEKTGDLGEALGRFVAYQQQLDLVRKELVKASMYPLVLLVAGGLVSVFLMLYVVPKFSRVYEDIGGNLPFFSQLLLGWGRFVENHTAAILGGLAIAAILGTYVSRLPATREWLQMRLWRMPAAGERMRIYQLARFYRTVGMLLRGGVPVVSALDMAGGMLHRALRGALAAASRSIREGHPISQAMEAQGLTTPVSFRMLRVGERSGNMGEMMERIAGFHDDEIARWVDWFTRLFGPILMGLMGLVIGAVVILMYLPIFELAGSINR